MRRNKSKGIYCIEGDWWGKPHRQSSVQPMLELLSKWDFCPVPYVCRDVATRDEFDYYLKQCTQKKFARFPIIYFAFHGAKGEVHIGDARKSDSKVDIQEIAETLEGRCAGKVLYFGCCDTLRIHGNELKGILKRTGAKAVCGYTCEVDWLESTAFDTMLLGQFQCNAITSSGLRAVQSRIRKIAKTLVDRLEFRMVVK
jgi:hypothetical protein